MTDDQVKSIEVAANKFNKKPTAGNFSDMALHIKMIFRQEEQLYADHLHPDTQPHTKIHNEFERVMAHFEQTYFVRNEKSKSTLNEFCLYIKNWTTLHKECYDESMMPYIRISQYVQGAA
jgi:hemerythrin